MMRCQRESSASRRILIDSRSPKDIESLSADVRSYPDPTGEFEPANHHLTAKSKGQRPPLLL